MSEPLTIIELIDIGERVLEDSTHIDADHDTRLEAEQLLAHALRIDHDDIDDDLQLVPPRSTRERYLALVARRAAGEPFPLLIGHTDFYGLTLRVRPGAFVPRASSELPVTRALRRLRGTDRPVVVDVCAGVAPVALALGHERPDAEVWALDISSEALSHGKDNARRLGIRNVRFRPGDMYEGLPSRLLGGVDLIYGHIPYVPPDEIDDLPTEVREYEPLYTLTDESDDGLNLMRRAVAEAPDWLAPGGWLLLEVSHDLVDVVRDMIRAAGLADAGLGRDSDDLSVVVEARRKRR